MSQNIYLILLYIKSSVIMLVKKAMFFPLLIFGLFLTNDSFSQGCPQGPINNNNGAGSLPTPCNSGDYVPNNWTRSGVWNFAGGPSTYQSIFTVKRNGVLYQDQNGLTQTFIDLNNAGGNGDRYPVFGGFWKDANNNYRMCFYGASANWNTPNNANWEIIFNSSSGSQCTYNVSGNGGATIVLPVTWETVSAEKQNGQSVLRWSTASEQNTKDFVVQHSLNTTDWSSLSTILAAGNSTTTRNYSYVHQNPLKGNNYNYYRILQRDLDDKFSYSKIVSIIFNEPGTDLQVYPNPVQDQLTVFLAETQMVRLVNAAGATVWKGQLPAGRNTIPVHTFSKGVYVLTAGMQSQRVLIQ